MTDTTQTPNAPPSATDNAEMYQVYDLAEDTRRSAYQYDQDPEYYFTQNGGE